MLVVGCWLEHLVGLGCQHLLFVVSLDMSNMCATCLLLVDIEGIDWVLLGVFRVPCRWARLLLPEQFLAVQVPGPSFVF